MPQSSKAIRTKISSVKNIGKITRAMELVSVSKMKKAVEQATMSREYAARALEILENLSEHHALRHPLLHRRRGKGALVVIISSNKGLCGAYNVNVQKTAQRYIKAHEGKEISVIAIGKYSEKAARALKANLKASFIDIGEEPHWNDTKVVADLIQEEFVKGEYEEVVVVYTKFISALSYTPVIQQLLPMRKKIFADFQETVGSEKSHVENVKREQVHEYLFEPSEDELLDAVLPRLVESQLYQAVLEARASEHSARMFAMRNASDNAGTLVKDLTLSYNRVRQSAITQELSEIVAGADAL